MKKVIHNGKIYVGRDHFVEAVLISGGRIEGIGTDEEMMAQLPEDCEIIDAQGKTVLPGMNDSHLHLGSIGEWLVLPDLSPARSIDDLVRIGREFIEKNPEFCKEGFVGTGWNQDYFKEKRIPTRYDIDRISTEIPIVFERVCGHVAAANSKALEMAGLLESLPEIEGGVFEVDEDGRPTGVLNEGGAINYVSNVIPEFCEEEWENLYIKSMEYAVSVGLTSVQSTDARDRNYKSVFRRMHKLYEEDKLLLRYRHQISLLKADSLKDYIETEYRQGIYDKEMLDLGPLKLFKDGSLGGRTGLMRKEYKDDPGNFGVEVLSNDQMDELVGLAAANGIQVITHVIGDGAVERTLCSYEKVIGKEGNVLRHALVHCQVTDKEQLERMAKGDILALVQPIFLDYDLHVVEDRVGKVLASTSYAFHTLDKLGVHVAYGTDAPIENCNPFPCLYCAVTRKDVKGFPEGGFNPRECVDVEQAIDNYTLGSAYAEFKEGVKGRIKPGYYADMIIIDRDIFTIPKDEIKEIKVDLTMVGGKVVYKRV